MKKILVILLLGVLPATSVFAQKARLDSLLSVLATQPEANARRMNTLIAASRACATIKPRRAIEFAKEAWLIADARNDEAARSLSWNAERWGLFCGGRTNEYDSVGDLAEAAARRSGDGYALAEAMIYRVGPDRKVFVDLGKPDNIPRVKARIDSCSALLRKMGDKAALAEALFWSGLLPYVNTGSARNDSALAIYTSLGDKSGMAMCLSCRFWHEPYASDTAATIRDLEQALSLAEEDGNLYWANAAHVNLMTRLLPRGEYRRTMEYALLTLKESEEMEDSSGIVLFNNNLGDLLDQMGDVEQAKVHYRAATRTAIKEYMPTAFNSLAAIFIRTHQPDSAEYYLEQAKANNRASGDDFDLASTHGLMGEVRAMQGDTAGALAELTEAIAVFRKYPSNFLPRIRAALALGRIHANASDGLAALKDLDRAARYGEALALFNEALKDARQFGVLGGQVDALLAKSEVLERMGDIHAALDLHQQYSILKDSLLNADKAKAVALLQVQYDTEKKEQQIALLGKDKEMQAKEIQKQKLVRNGFIGGFALVALFAGVFLVQRNKVSKARKRSDELLLNILPEEVADELKEKGHADARHFDTATILFTDFKGFTQLSEKVTPAELVAELNTCFKAFDGIMEKYRIEKIKTIGDAYMAAGGLPDPQHGSAAEVVRAALEMQVFMAKHKSEREAQGKPFFEMRVGVHSGPVVAGIVGVKKFQYDIWGDTVNTASRMESSGEVGKVNISEATYQLLVNGEQRMANGTNEDGVSHSPFTNSHSPAFHFTPRGKVQSKGKGEMEMYYVEPADSF